MFGGNSFKLFTLAGFRIGAHWSFAAALVVAGLTRGGVSGVVFSLALFASILLHELGHALVARRRGVIIDGIDLHFFGGVAKMRTPPRSANDEIAIAVAGPLVSLALGLGFLALSLAVPVQMVAWLGIANVVLAVFNMLPALPMDGGRVLRAVLAKRRGLFEGTRIAVVVSRVLAVGLGVLGVFTNPWLVLLAALVWMMGGAEMRGVREHQFLSRMGIRGSPWDRYQRSVL
jgi:Zn-dependent protease